VPRANRNKNRQYVQVTKRYESSRTHTREQALRVSGRLTATTVVAGVRSGLNALYIESTNRVTNLQHVAERCATYVREPEPP